MFPEGHGAEAYTSPPPYEISVSDRCSTDKPITVTISVTDNNKTWFEGFLVQARPVRGENITYGIFETNNDRQLQGLQCPNSPAPGSNNSIGHREAKKYYKKVFTWTPPPTGVKGGIQFVATIIHETPEFWMNVRSPTVASPCAATALIPAIGYIMAAFFAARLAKSLNDD
jgi:hypothetical protein